MAELMKRVSMESASPFKRTTRFDFTTPKGLKITPSDKNRDEHPKEDKRVQ